MGWARGSSIMDEIINCLKRRVSNSSQRLEVYLELIEIFKKYDCDTLQECQGNDSVFDLALYEYKIEYEE